MIRKTIAAALLAATFATPALAQSSAPGGFYVGALGGYEGIAVESADGAVSADEVDRGDGDGGGPAGPRRGD